MIKKKSIGQSTLEYAVIIAVVVAGLYIMNIYMRRGVIGKLRESVDEVGEQYSAGNMTSKYTTEQTGEAKTKETFGLASEDSKTRKQGVSYQEVTQAATVTHTAKGDDAEKVTTKLSDEKLFKE